VCQDLIGLWLEQANNLTDFNAGGLRGDVAFRIEWCEKAGSRLIAGACNAPKTLVLPFRYKLPVTRHAGLRRLA
jgi:hypothetical protein